MAKRGFDLFFTIPGMLCLLPLFCVLGLWIWLDSSGPVFFRQERVGLHEKPFYIFKFRTMIVDAERIGKQITVGADRRVTRSGSFLRKYKLDELPQLLNVLLGDMSLVGPRPEVPRYVKEYTSEERKIVFSVRPGITDRASVEYRDENEILGQAVNPEQTYIREVLPIKIAYYKKYALHHTVWGDFILIWRTFGAIVH